MMGSHEMTLACPSPVSPVQISLSLTENVEIIHYPAIPSCTATILETKRKEDCQVGCLLGEVQTSWGFTGEGQVGPEGTGGHIKCKRTNNLQSQQCDQQVRAPMLDCGS